MVFSAASAVLFGVTPAVASRIYSMGGNAVTLTFYRNLMAVPVLLALLGLEGVSLRLTRREAGLLLLMGAGFLLAAVFNRPAVRQRTDLLLLLTIALSGAMVIFTFLPPDHVLFADLS